MCVGGQSGVCGVDRSPPCRDSSLSALIETYCHSDKHICMVSVLRGFLWMEGAEKNSAVNQLSISENDREEARLLMLTALRGGGSNALILLSSLSLALTLVSSSRPLHVQRTLN